MEAGLIMFGLCIVASTTFGYLYGYWLATKRSKDVYLQNMYELKKKLFILKLKIQDSMLQNTDKP
jgi:hypothetical protein